MVKCFTRISKVLCCCVFAALSSNQKAAAQVSLNPFTTSYNQDFNTLPATSTGTWVSGTEYFPGWHLNRTNPATTSILYGTGTSNAGGVYSFGAAGNTDRALGAVSTGTAGEFAWGLLIQNNSGKTITALHINYTGEQWRSSSSTAPAQTTTFWFATNSDKSAFNLSPKSDAGWTSVKELDFSGPVFKTLPGPLDGNAPANKRFLAASIPVTIPNGHFVMLRWKDLNDLYDDHGLAIDDFNMTWSTEASGGPAPLPVELVSFSATEQQNTVALVWATASEKNNDHFIVERSQNGKQFESIATLIGKGNSAIRSNYSFTDATPLSGLSYYRLKQVDFDGTYTYSKVAGVKVTTPDKAILYPTITSDNLYLDAVGSDQSVAIYDLSGKQVYQEQFTAQSNNYKLNVNQLKAGNYNLLLFNSKGERQVLRFIKR